MRYLQAIDYLSILPFEIKKIKLKSNSTLFYIRKIRQNYSYVISNVSIVCLLFLNVPSRKQQLAIALLTCSWGERTSSIHNRNTILKTICNLRGHSFKRPFEIKTYLIYFFSCYIPNLFSNCFINMQILYEKCYRVICKYFVTYLWHCIAYTCICIVAELFLL